MLRNLGGLLQAGGCGAAGRNGVKAVGAWACGWGGSLAVGGRLGQPRGRRTCPSTFSFGLART